MCRVPLRISSKRLWVDLCGQQIPGRPSLNFSQTQRNRCVRPFRATSQLDSSMGFRVLQRHHLEQASLGNPGGASRDAGSQVSQFLPNLQVKSSVRAPESQETAALQNVPAPSRQKCGKTFGRNHLWLSTSPARPGPKAPPSPGQHAPAEVPFHPRAPLRSGPRCQPGGAAPARWLALRWLSPPPSPTSSRLLPLHGCRTEPLNSHRSPPPPARRAGDASAPAGAPGRADRRPPSNSSGDHSPAPAMYSHPSGSSATPRPASAQARCGEDRDPRRRCPSSAREATHLCAPPDPRASRTWRRAAVLASSFAAAAVRLSLRAEAARAARLSESRGRAAPAVWSRAAVAGARQLLPPRAAPPPSWRPASRASAAVSPAPRAPRPRCPRHRLGVRTGLKGPDVCGRPSPAPAPSPAPPPRPATHALAASQPPPRLQLISILTVTVAAGGAPRTRRGGGQQSGRGAGGGVGGRAEPPSAWGSSSFLFLSFFSLCLLQDLKGQPRPRRGARRPPFLRSPDALCGPAGPSRTRSTGSRPPGIFRSTPGPGQRGGGAWLDGPGALLFLQSPIVGVGEEMKQLSSCFSNRKS